MKKGILNLKFVVVIIIFTLIFGAFGSIWLSRYIIDLCFKDVNVECEYIKDAVKENEQVYDYFVKQNINIYENSTKNLAYIIRESKNEKKVLDDKVIELLKMAEISNTIVLDNEGNVIESLKPNLLNFAEEKYDKLREVFYDTNKSTMLTIEQDEFTDYYFAAKINEGYEVVVYCDGVEVKKNADEVLGWHNIILDKELEKTLRTFVLEKGGDKIIYNVDDSYIGKNLRIGQNILHFGDYEFVKIFNECGFIKKASFDNADIVFFMSLYNIIKRPVVFMGFALLVFLICLIFISLYSIVVSEEANLIKEGFSDTLDKRKYDNVRKKKINIITLVVTVVMVVSMVFFVHIFSISTANETSSHYYNKEKSLLYRSSERIDGINKLYQSYVGVNDGFLKIVLQIKPETVNQKNLKRVADVLGIEEIRILDLDGKTIYASNGMDKFRLSDSKDDPTYKCWELLNEDGYILLPVSKDIDGNKHQYVCSTLRDEENNVVGIIMAKYDVTEIYNIEQIFDSHKYIGSVLKDTGEFFYIADKKKGEYIDASSSKIIGQKIDSGILPKEVITSDYQGFLYFDGKDLFGRTLQVDDTIISVFLNIKKIGDGIMIDIGLITLFAVFLIFIYKIFAEKISKSYSLAKELIEVDDSQKVSLDRLFITNWSRITGSQKVSLLISYLFDALMLIFSIIFLFGDKIFGETSIISYIINGNWHRSLNVLALSKCILVLSFVLFVAFLAIKLLSFLGHCFDARGVTICKLIANFIRYAAIFVSIYQCLSLIGIDAKTLVASAGILSLIVGFGANKLIQEIVSGLFIIFEGAFKVGDTISQKDFTGVVKEIGIRNTQIESVDGNVLIASNSSLTSVINHSTAKSLIVYEYKIPKTITLDACDKFFNSKIDYLKEKIGKVVKDIKYDGIVAYENDTYTIRFSIYSKEEKKARIEYKIDEEMKMLINELRDTINA